MNYFELPTRTVNSPINDGAIEIRPSQAGKLMCDGVHLTHAAVVWAEETVDVEQNGVRKYLVEHAVAASTMMGIQSAEILGVERAWNTNRATHVKALANKHNPWDVLGSATGKIWAGPTSTLCFQSAAIAGDLTQWFIVENEIKIEADPAKLPGKSCKTTIILSPPRNLDKLAVKCTANGHCAEILFCPQDGVLDKKLLYAIFDSPSIAVSPGFEWSDEKYVWHALGDVIGDIYGLGRLYADLEVNLGLFYHSATYAAVKEAYLIHHHHIGKLRVELKP